MKHIQSDNFKVSPANFKDEWNKVYPFKLTFPPKVKAALKKHCHYQTFTFYYVTEDEAYRDGQNTLKELSKATGTDYK